MIVFGWDVSTSIIGMSAIDKDSLVLKKCGFINLAKATTMFEKYNMARDQMAKFISNFDGPFMHYVEEPLKSFTFGQTNKNTLMKLSAMNAVVSCFLNDRDPGKVSYLAPVSAKKMNGLIVDKSDGKDAKKKAAAKFAVLKEPTFPVKYTASGELSVGVGDLADSYILARAGALVERGEVSIGQTKKNLGPGKSSRKRIPKKG